MNRSYKIIFNRARGTYAVTDEVHTSKGKKKAVTVAVAAVMSAVLGGGY